jgi:hypothetical protein
VFVVVVVLAAVMGLMTVNESVYSGESVPAGEYERRECGRSAGA